MQGEKSRVENSAAHNTIFNSRSENHAALEEDDGETAFFYAFNLPGLERRARSSKIDDLSAFDARFGRRGANCATLALVESRWETCGRFKR